MGYKKRTDPMWEVYDAHAVKLMGEEMGFMGSFRSEEDAEAHIKEYKHLFEGEPIIRRIR